MVAQQVLKKGVGLVHYRGGWVLCRYIIYTYLHENFYVSNDSKVLHFIS